MEITDSQIGELISEGKTKRVFRLNRNGFNNDFVYVVNKDNISAGDNSRSRRIMEGKGRISVETSSAIFHYLNCSGVKTAFVSHAKSPSPDFEKSFVAKYCQMIPIEIVIRRLATGTFLKLNPNMTEGFRFITPEIEIHIKDDINHDPLWSIETLLEAKFIINGLLIGEKEIKTIFKISQLVFELIEKVWQSIDYQLVDLKVEFGVFDDENGEKSLILADIIDNETWRLWHKCEKKLMVDKQIYREYKDEEITEQVVEYVKSMFEKVADLSKHLFSPKNHININQSLLIITDTDYNMVWAKSLSNLLQSNYGICGENLIKIETITDKYSDFDKLIDEINQMTRCAVIVTIVENQVISSVISANTAIPVINCIDRQYLNQKFTDDINYLISIEYENTSLNVAKILANNNLFIWSKIKTFQCYQNIEYLNE